MTHKCDTYIMSYAFVIDIESVSYEFVTDIESVKPVHSQLRHPGHDSKR